jgi:hypothetical protein
MTITDLCADFPNVRALYAEAQNPQPCGPNFCAYQLWHGLPGDRGNVGLKYLIQQNVPLEHQELVMNACRRVMPGCKHSFSVAWTDENGVQHECACPTDYTTPPPTAELGWESLKRERPKPAFRGLLQGLRYLAGQGPPPEPVKIVRINDDAEPLFIVRSVEEARRVRIDLRISERLQREEISLWYARECTYTCDPAARRVVMASRLNKEKVTGPLSWKPVVLTFTDPELEKKLGSICTQVVTVLPGKDGVLSLDAVRAAIKEIVGAEKIKVHDLPEAALDGWLGEICRTRMGDFPRAYAWPALITAASVLVPRCPDPKTRTNLYCGLVGEKGSGKSTAFDFAFSLLGLDATRLLKLKSGSAEGLVAKIGSVDGAARLFFTDELEHLLVKSAIEGSSFASVLSSAYYDDKQDFTMARGKEVPFNCRLSLAGGVVEDKFADLFGAATTGGFYDRFIFGLCPTDNSYSYRPFTGGPALETEEDEWYTPVRPVAVTIAEDVWPVKDQLEKELGERRVVESALRVAVICAAFDGRKTLTAADLGPMKAFAEYQANLRKRLAPNPGKNAEAVVAYKILEYLRAHAPQGEWLGTRDMIRSIHAYHYGPSITLRALASLAMNEEVEQSKAGRKALIRLAL